MSMYDTAKFDFLLPNGNKLSDINRYEIQCSIECMFCNYIIKNYGNYGYSKHLPYNPFSLLRNTSVYFSLGDGCSVWMGSICLKFNRLGVLTRFEWRSYDKNLCRTVVDEDRSFDWPSDQIKKYNKEAIIEILKLMPSRFKEGVSYFTRLKFFIGQYFINLPVNYFKKYKH